MFKTIQIIVMAVLCLNFGAFSQSQTNNIRPLKIGDTIPEELWSLPLQVVNHPEGKDKITLNDYRGKLIILDFWTTYCTPCIRLLPKYDSLQNQFGKSLQILLVNNENSIQTVKFLKKFPYKLTSVVSDTILQKLFPHTFIPHEVWIKDNIIKAFTDGNEVTSNNILQLMESKPVSMHIKNDNLTYDWEKPLLINSNGGAGQVLFHSLITPYINGLPSSTGIHKTSNSIKACFVNSTPLTLFQKAFSDINSSFLFDNRVIFEVSDTLRAKLQYNKTSSASWVRQFTFSYDLVIPLNYPVTIFEQMRNDINRFFLSYYGITAQVENREVNCLVLSKISPNTSLGTKEETKSIRNNEDEYSISNQPFSYLITLISNSFSRLETPFIDNTGYNGKFDIKLHGYFSDNLFDLQQQLKSYGLKLQFEKKRVEMLVLSQKDQKYLGVNNELE